MIQPIIKPIIKTALLTVLLTAIHSAPSLAFSEPRHPKGGMFAKQDTNNDGKVTKAEAVSDAEKRFDEMDADHNGSITKEEITTYFDKKRKEHCKD
jgi:hypothetical protein